MDGDRLKYLLGVWGDVYLIYDLSHALYILLLLRVETWSINIFLLLRVETLSIHIGRSYGTY